MHLILNVRYQHIMYTTKNVVYTALHSSYNIYVVLNWVGAYFSISWVFHLRERRRILPHVFWRFISVEHCVEAHALIFIYLSLSHFPEKKHRNKIESAFLIYELITCNSIPQRPFRKMLNFTKYKFEREIALNIIFFEEFVKTHINIKHN